MADLLLWLLAVEVLGLVALPLAYLLFKRLPDRGITLSKVLGLLLSSYMFWVLGLTGFVPTSRYTVVGILVVLALVSGLLLRTRVERVRAFLWRERYHLLAVEVLFLGIFFMWAAIVSQVPAINHTEKPMDFGFLNAIVRSDGFPPEDMWLAGQSISYYYFGHLMMGGLTKLTSIPTSVTYNLSVVLIPALVSVAAYGLVYNLVRLAGGSRGRAVVFGMLAPVFIGLIGNLVGVLDLVQARGWGSEGFWQWVNIKDLSASTADGASLFPQDYNWWWHSTRVIDTVVDGNSLDFTITEFPFFSFLLGDLHAHVMSLPFTVLALSLSLNVFLSKSPLGLGWLRAHPWESLALALGLGALAFINIGDLPVFVAFFLGMLLVRALKDHGRHPLRAAVPVLIVAVPILVLAGLMFLPYYLTLNSQASGIFPLREVSTRPLFFILLWGLFLAITGAFLLRQLRSMSLPGKGDEGILALTVVLTFLPVVLWGVIVFSVTILDDGLADAVATVGSRFGKLIPLFLLVGVSMYSALSRARTGPAPLVFTLALMSLGFYLLMGIELFYIKDFLPLRMNTVFKLTYQAWLLLAIASAFGAYYWLSQPLPKGLLLRLGSHALVGVVGLLVLLSFYYPVGAALDRVDGSSDSPTLDGLAFIQDSPFEDKGEYEAIVRLRDEAPRGRILEAVGGAYTAHGRIASSTGLPSPLNWPGHEIQWRGSGKPLAGREDDVATIYQSNDLDKVRGLLDKHKIRYVYLGNRERRMYGIQGLDKFSQLMKVFFQAGDVVVYERIEPLMGVTSDSG